LRIISLDRRLLASDALRLPNEGSLDPAWVIQTLDDHDLPDGFPLVVDDDGGISGCWSLNQYLLDAWAQRAFDLGSMRKFHVYHLSRVMRFVRMARAASSAQVAGMDLHEWLDVHGEPFVDLMEATRRELVDYRDSRKRTAQDSTVDTEIGCLSAFFRYATESKWIARNPVPYWGGKNSLMSHTHDVRQSRFLNAAQTRHVLDVGLRGDGATPQTRPGYAERDYCYGLLLASTGLRREECAYLLDCEVPPPSDIGASGVYTFRRKGKMGKTRSVYIAAEVAGAVNLYRQTERRRLVQIAQRTLRRQLAAGRLLVVDRVTTRADGPAYVLNGVIVSTVVLTDEDRARAVMINDDGTIEPLGLLLGRFGLPPVLERWNQLFADARDRVEEAGTANRPPNHVTVTPHTMRHTFAVRMLAALMREGRDRSGNAYLLLANPLLTVMELMGHADAATTQRYLFAAETWEEGVPEAVRATAASLLGHTADNPGDAFEDGRED
jgi:integrase